ncbi:DUF2795 domain-containing protein [Streptomyces sp. NPDC003362]
MDRATSARDVVDAIKDVDFPADKEKLIDAARRAGASQDVVAALRGMPQENYTNRDDVARSVRLAPDSDLGLTRAQQAEQARMGGKPGQSQHLRDVPKTPIEEELDR